MNDFEQMIQKAAALRGCGPYLTADAITKFHREMKKGRTTYHSYLSAITTLDVGAARIDMRKPDTGPRTWGTQS